LCLKRRRRKRRRGAWVREGGEGCRGSGWEVEEKKKKKAVLFVVNRSRLGHMNLMEIRYLTFNYRSVLKVQYCIAQDPFGYGAYIYSLFSKSVLMVLSDLIIRLSGFLSVLLGCSSSFLSLTSSTYSL
jgi:hypothetical protein